jgi:replication-associated recombination protein RarA
MAYKSQGTCPVATAVFIRKQAERQGISLNESIRRYAAEAEIPEPTVRKWAFRKEKVEKVQVVEKAEERGSTKNGTDNQDSEKMEDAKMAWHAGLVTTTGGYKLDEVLSALQKSIRRGMEEDALYWAAEADKSGYGGHVWGRLTVIVSEDIGLAAPGMIADIMTLYELWKKKMQETKAVIKQGGRPKYPERLYLIHAVLLMVRSQKSRIVDHAAICAYCGGLERREMPDYAVDVHTAAGKRAGVTRQAFLAEGGKLVNESEDLPDEYIDRAKPIILSWDK